MKHQTTDNLRLNTDRLIKTDRSLWSPARTLEFSHRGPSWGRRASWVDSRTCVTSQFSACYRANCWVSDTVYRERWWVDEGVAHSLWFEWVRAESGRVFVSTCRNNRNSDNEAKWLGRYHPLHVPRLHVFGILFIRIKNKCVQQKQEGEDVLVSVWIQLHPSASHLQSAIRPDSKHWAQLHCLHFLF